MTILGSGPNMAMRVRLRRKMSDYLGRSSCAFPNTSLPHQLSRPGAAGEKLRKATSTLRKLGTMEHYCNQLHVREELEGKCKRKTATSNILDPIADSGSGELLFPLPLSPVDPELTRCSSKLALSRRVLSLRFTNFAVTPCPAFSNESPRYVGPGHSTSLAGMWYLCYFAHPHSPRIMVCASAHLLRILTLLFEALHIFQ